MVKMNGKLISENKLKKLPVGTKLLVRDLEEDYYWSCTLEKDDNYFYLCDTVSGCNLTEVSDLKRVFEIYEYHEEDAARFIKKEPSKEEPKNHPPRYVFDKEWMVILDTKENHIVCLVGTKRPDLLESKLGELLELANRP